MAMTENRMRIKTVGALVGLAIAGVAVLLVLNEFRNRVDVFEAHRQTPSIVELAVASCNRMPFVDEFEEIEPGIYEVLVRTELPSNGTDCNDIVAIDVDPTQETIVVIDRSSGDRFEALNPGS